MILSLCEIYNFCDCMSEEGSQNYREAEEVLEIGNLLKCGKISNISKTDCIQLRAYCLQTQKQKETPYILDGEIDANGTINYFQCSCEAGAEQRCKHVLAALIYCYKTGLDNLKELSCSDFESTWKNASKELTQKSECNFIGEHKCYRQKYIDLPELSPEKIGRIDQILKKFQENAYSQSMGEDQCGENEISDFEIL